MSDFSDPPEFVGRDNSQRADPVPSKRKPVAPKPVAQPSVAEVHPEVKTGSHPKHAIERPRREFEAAQQEVRDAHAEMSAANLGLVDAEIAETEALVSWLSLQPKQDPDKLLRDHANRAVEQRAANVAAGLPPEGIKPARHNRSGVDTAASQRPRQSAQQPSTPLRSPVARRLA